MALNSKKININWRKVLEYSLPVIIPIVITVLAMIVKGVYPFGEKSIGYIDYDEQLVPFYTNLWDILHGKANLFVDWNLGGGGSIITSFVINGFLSPLAWMIAIFPRSGVIYAIAFLVIIKFSLMSLTAYICFKKYFQNVNQYILLLFSLIWTFSGWTLVHFANIGWLDIMILLPLLMISAKKLILEGKNLWFVIILTYMLMLSYYISYMVLVGTVVISLMYTIFIAKEKKKVAASMFFAVMISILISFVAFIPSCLTSLQAHRFTNVEQNLKSDLFAPFFSKLVVLIMYAIPFVFFVKLLFKIKEDKKTVLFFLITFITLSIGLLIEPINKMWHTGSYFCYPLRYGFVIIMFVIFGALYYIDKYLANKDNTDSTNKDFSYLVLAIGTPLLMVLFIVNGVMGTNAHPYRNISFLTFLFPLLTFALSYLLIEMLLKLKSAKLKLGNVCGGVLIFVLCIINITVSAIGYIGSSEEYDTTIRTSNVQNLDLSELDASYKLKDREALYNLNFATITQYPTLQTWIHISSEQQFLGYDKLGLNTASVCLYSSGGTILTDVLLGNKYVLSREELSGKYYEKIDQFKFDYEVKEYTNESKTKYKMNVENGVMYLYETKLNFYNVLTTNVDLNELFNEEKYDYFDNQNKLFRALYNQDYDILHSIAFEITEDKDNFIINSTVPTDKITYMSIKGFEIKTELNDFDRTLMSGINDLGIIENGNLTIAIPKNENSKLNLNKLKENIKFGAFDIETFSDLHNNLPFNESKIVRDGSQLKIEINNSLNHKYAFIPYVYLNHMTAVNNNTSTEVTNGINAFMMVELGTGENQIVISYEPQYLKLCSIVTIVALIIFIVFAILNHKFNLANKKFVIWSGFIGGCIILAAVGFLVYVKPFFNFFVILFS